VFFNSLVQLKDQSEPFLEVKHNLMTFFVELARGNSVDFVLAKLSVVAH
jgi:hypothetical protein